MAKKIQTLNIGASTVALAEYDAGSGGALTLVNYGVAPLAAPVDAGNADTILVPPLMQIMREKGIRPGKVAVSVSGQMAFLRPAAIAMAGGQDKFEQMVRYEIEQNIPFPLDEMVCDRQILGDTENGDKAVLIVAAKIEQIESVTNAGFSPELVDVAPVALTNALRGIVGDGGACTVMLDIGAKTTSLVISEGEKIYNRSIPVAGNTITKEIAQALGCTLEEAEQIKRDSAYVSMGGVTEDADETLDRISKVCRAVLTRLNAEISRSINFYRSQQNGGMPQKLYLTGGSALLPQIDAFFADSLGIEVEFFNPFAYVSLSNSVDATALQTDSAVLGVTTGIAMHAAGNAPIAINLLPPSLIEQRAEVRKIPVVAVGAIAFAISSVCWLMSMNHSIEVVEAQNESIAGMDAELTSLKSKVDKAVKALGAQKVESDEMRKILSKRIAPVWQLDAVRDCLGDFLWIEKWEKGKITIRGWSDKISKSLGNNTAEDFVAENLRHRPNFVKADSVKIGALPPLGKDGCLQQFEVELEFQDTDGEGEQK